MFCKNVMTSVRKIANFASDESGATAIEYGLFAALIGAVIVGTVATLGAQTDSGFDTVSCTLHDAGITATGSAACP